MNYLTTLILAASLIATSSAAAGQTSSTGQINEAALASQVTQVTCYDRGQRLGRGSAFRIGDNLVTAAHVWNAGDCRIDNSRPTENDVNASIDFAVLTPRRVNTTSLEHSCEALQANGTYTAVGYRNGKIKTIQARHSGLRLTAADYPDLPELFLGTEMFTSISGDMFLEGMSGGPVLNAQGQVIGMIVGYDGNGHGSFVRLLRDTTICQNTNRIALAR